MMRSHLDWTLLVLIRLLIRLIQEGVNSSSVTGLHLGVGLRCERSGEKHHRRGSGWTSSTRPGSGPQHLGLSPPRRRRRPTSCLRVNYTNQATIVTAQPIRPR